MIPLDQAIVLGACVGAACLMGYARGSQIKVRPRPLVLLVRRPWPKPFSRRADEYWVRLPFAGVEAFTVWKGEDPAPDGGFHRSWKAASDRIAEIQAAERAAGGEASA
jgi:hypothetical protein